MYFFSEYHLIYLTTRGMAPRRDAEKEKIHQISYYCLFFHHLTRDESDLMIQNFVRIYQQQR